MSAKKEVLKLIRTDSDNPDFIQLVKLLDAELNERDGDEHSYYSQYNRLDTIKNAVIAYINENALGCGAFRKYREDTAEIKRMFVKSELRGKAIGVKILGELEKWAEELGMNTFILETGKRQPEAIRLYEKSGYTVIPNYGQYGGIENSVCMKKIVK
jgi:GNAT superfamily N-acetyltransferase